MSLSVSIPSRLNNCPGDYTRYPWRTVIRIPWYGISDKQEVYLTAIAGGARPNKCFADHSNCGRKYFGDRSLPGFHIAKGPSLLVVFIHIGETCFHELHKMREISQRFWTIINDRVKNAQLLALNMTFW